MGLGVGKVFIFINHQNISKKVVSEGKLMGHIVIPVLSF